MKNKKLNFIVLFIALALVLYFTLKDDFHGIVSKLKEANAWIFIISVIFLLISLFFKSISLKTFIKEYKSDYTGKDAYVLTLIGQFLNGITPFQSGGQPFQIYLLKKDGLRISDSTNAMIKDGLSYQLALVLVGILTLLLNLKFCVLSKNVYINGLIFLGFGINLIVLILILIVAFAKKTGFKIANKIICFAFKFKIIRKFGTSEERVKEGLKHFYKTGSEIKKDKGSIIKGIIFNVIHLSFLYVIPFIIFKSIGINGISIVESVIATSFVMLIGNIIPIPGATGGIEYGFMQFFGTFTKGAVLSGSMLLWRFVTYFLPMIIGYVCLLLKKGTKRL